MVNKNELLREIGSILERHEETGDIVGCVINVTLEDGAQVFEWDGEEFIHRPNRRVTMEKVDEGAD